MKKHYKAIITHKYHRKSSNLADFVKKVKMYKYITLYWAKGRKKAPKSQYIVKIGLISYINVYSTIWTRLIMTKIKK